MADNNNTGRPGSETNSEPAANLVTDLSDVSNVASLNAPSQPAVGEASAARAAQRSADRVEREEENEEDTLFHPDRNQTTQAPQSPRYPAWDIVTGEPLMVPTGIWDQQDIETHLLDFYTRAQLIIQLRNLPPAQRSTLGVSVSSSTRSIAHALAGIDPRVGKRRELFAPSKNHNCPSSTYN